MSTNEITANKIRRNHKISLKYVQEICYLSKQIHLLDCLTLFVASFKQTKKLLNQFVVRT